MAVLTAKKKGPAIATDTVNSARQASLGIIAMSIVIR